MGCTHDDAWDGADADNDDDDDDDEFDCDDGL